MRKVFVKTALALLLVTVCFGAAEAQTGSITIDSVNGLYATDTIEVGTPVEFIFRLVNNTGETVFGSANGFRVYSPDLATWTPAITVDTNIITFPTPSTNYDTTVYAEYIDPPNQSGGVLVWQGGDGTNTFTIYDGGLFINTFSTDGAGSDTVGFAGFQQDDATGFGIIDGFDDIGWKIKIASVDASSHGKTLCIDSSYFRPSGVWKWAALAPNEYLPAWGGPYCYEIFDPNATGGTGEFTSTGLGTSDSLYYPAQGGTYPDRQFDLTSDGDPITFNIAIKNNAPWLSVSPTSGTTPQTITVSVDPSQGSGQVADTLVISGSAKAADFLVPVYFDISLGVTEIGGNLPTAYALNQNYPNPFNPTTTIKFALPEATNVSLDIYNVLGQKVRTLVSEPLAANNYEIEWDGQNDAGSNVASGIYFYKLQTDTFVNTKKMILSR